MSGDYDAGEIAPDLGLFANKRDHADRIRELVGVHTAHPGNTELTRPEWIAVCEALIDYRPKPHTTKARARQIGLRAAGLAEDDKRQRRECKASKQELVALRRVLEREVGDD